MGQYLKGPITSDRKLRVVSLVMATITLATFVTAVLTPPLSGPFCQGDCFTYPYAGVASRFPRDYYWMYLALGVQLAVIGFLVLQYTRLGSRSASALFGLILGSAGAGILLLNYYVQVSVIQSSLVAGEHDGVAMLTQFNPHGMFIVLEELGFLLTAIGFASALLNHERRAVRWTAVTNVILNFASVGAIAIAYGIQKEYVLEVVLISLNWLSIFGIGLMQFFQRSAARVHIQLAQA